jgi:hypothetical protein
VVEAPVYPQRLSPWYGKRKTFAEEVDEIIEEMKVEVPRAVRKVFESPD